MQSSMFIMLMILPLLCYIEHFLLVIFSFYFFVNLLDDFGIALWLKLF